MEIDKKSEKCLAEWYPLDIILKLKASVSTADWVDVKGIQVGVIEELDTLYFLLNKRALLKRSFVKFNLTKKKV